jgi:hypothetical protein
MYEGTITGFRPPTVPAEELGRLMAGGTEEAPGAGSQAAIAEPAPPEPAPEAGTPGASQ